MNMTLRQLDLWMRKANERLKAINGPAEGRGRK